MSLHIERRYFTVDEYSRMGEAGIFSGDDRVELIEGEIIRMDPIVSCHAGCVGRLTEVLGRQAIGESILWVQNPIRINDHSELLPDVVLLKRRNDFYATAHPIPGDVLLIIEVADTSVEHDREVKIPLYARSGIPEVWLVNLPKDSIEIHTRPLDGAYREIRLVKRGESFASQTVSNLTLDVDAIFS